MTLPSLSIRLGLCALLLAAFTACETTRVVEVHDYVPERRTRRPTPERTVSREPAPKPASPSEFRVVNQYD